MGRRIARIKVGYDFLASALYLPKGARVVYAEKAQPNLYMPDWFEVYIESQDFPELIEGCDAPEITPTFNVEMQDDNLVPNKIVTCDWNLPK
jgi:hypothetical protein